MTKDSIGNGQEEQEEGGVVASADSEDYPRFRKPLIGPAGGIPAVPEKHLSWPEDLEE